MPKNKQKRKISTQKLVDQKRIKNIINQSSRELNKDNSKVLNPKDLIAAGADDDYIQI